MLCTIAAGAAMSRWASHFEMGYRAPTVMMEMLEGKTGDPVIYAGLDECKQDNAGTCIGG